MQQENKGFSKFSWALALFCLPSALWPLALMVSPKFTNSPNLTPSQIDWFSIAFWVYPMVLLAISGILYKVHQTKPGVARACLTLGFIAFYGLFFYIICSV